MIIESNQIDLSEDSYYLAYTIIELFQNEIN